MDNEKIKELLISLRGTDTVFTVIQTGKESKRVNGLYKPDTHEILLHNKNFKNDNQLMYTAIHEYTHHLLNIGVNSVRCHNTEFWSLFYDLIETAEQKNIYSRDRSQEIKELESAAHKIEVEIAEAYRSLGKVLQKLHELCEKEGVRYEDVVDHDLQMKRTTAKKAAKAAVMEGNVDKNAGQDMQEQIVEHMCGKQKNTEFIEAVKQKKTIMQIKQSVKKEDGETDYDRLTKEKKRIIKTIDALNLRLATIEDILSEQ
jgi:hypothetical protein